MFLHLLKPKKKKRKKEIREIRENKKEHNQRSIKYRLIRDIKTLFEQEEQEDYYKPERVNNFWNNNYTEYKSNGDNNRNLSLNKYLNKIEPLMRNIIIDLQNSDAWKI